MTYDCDDAIRFQGAVEVAQELVSEESDGLGATGEDIMDDVVIALGGVVGDLRRVVDSVVNYGVVVGCEVEVLDCVLQDDGVDLDDRRVDAVGHEGTRTCANAGAAVRLLVG